MSGTRKPITTPSGANGSGVWGVIEAAVKEIPTVKTERFVPPIANHVPHVMIFWDESRVRIDRDKVTEKLAAGDPSISLGRVRGTGDKGLLVSVFQLKPGNSALIVAPCTAVIVVRCRKSLLESIAALFAIASI